MSEETFRVIVQNCLRCPQYGGLAGSVGSAVFEAIDHGWSIHRMRRMANEYGFPLETVLATMGLTTAAVRQMRSNPHEELRQRAADVWDGQG